MCISSSYFFRKSTHFLFRHLKIIYLKTEIKSPSLKRNQLHNFKLYYWNVKAHLNTMFSNI